MSFPNKFLTGATGRQLMDLRKQPSVATVMINNERKTVADNRPHFDLGQMPESDPDYGIQPPFRQLLWHPTTGVEVCATTQSEVNSYRHQGYLDYPLLSAAVNPVESARDELAALTEDERNRVLAAVKKQRLEQIQARLSKLSDAELLDVQTAPVKQKTA